MVSAALVKLSSPVARSCLIALGIALLIDAILIIYAANQYPYLIDYNHDDLYISSSRTIAFVYSSISLLAIVVSISTAVAVYKSATNYVLIHGGITGVFLPLTILVYFSTISFRYRANDYVDDFHQFIADYRISRSLTQRREQQTANGDHTHKVKQPSLESYDSISAAATNQRISHLSSFSNHIDSVQKKFSCCGVESVQDWIKHWNNYIPATCCREYSTDTNPDWAKMFNLDHQHEFKYCTENQSYHLGCVVALKEDEHSKYAWLSDLIIFMIMLVVANTIVALVMFGLTKTEDDIMDKNEHELSIVGVSNKPRPSQPTIMSIKHRPSVVVSTLGSSSENISARAQAVRFNMASNSPRGSISGPSKFSAAARRGSSFI